nr:hypothetical protein [Alicyclobacillus mengziensis]
MYNVAFFGRSSNFWVNVPIGIIGFVLGLFLLPHGRGQGRTQAFDYAGTTLFIVGIVGLLYTVTNAEVWRWTSDRTLIGFDVSVLVLILFGWSERVAKRPMIDFSLYRNRVFTTASFAAVLSFISLFCTNTMMPLNLEDVLHATHGECDRLRDAEPVVDVSHCLGGGFAPGDLRRRPRNVSIAEQLQHHEHSPEE